MIKIYKALLFLFLFQCDIALSITLKNTRQMLSFIKPFISNFPVVLKIGGSENDIREIKSIYPYAKIYVFQPLLDFKKIVKQKLNFPYVFYYPFALTSYSGRSKFYVNKRNKLESSIDSPVEWNEHEFDKIPLEIPCTTINSWVKSNSINKIDFIWIDMSGYEINTLQNSPILNRVKVIYSKIAYIPIRNNSCLYPRFRKFLEEHKFGEAWKSFETGVYGNGLFIKNYKEN